MRRRLLVTYLSLLAVVISALAVPLAVVITARNTQVVFIDRKGDTTRFASFADTALRSGNTDSLDARLTRYDELFGIVAAVFDRDGRLVVASRDDPSLDGPEIKAAVRTALAGEGSAADQVVWPWQTRPLVVAEPVGHGGEIIGAVVTVSPVRGIRADTLTGWLWVAGFMLLAVLVAAYAARRLAAWMLRPVLNLDETTHAIAAGQLAARVPAAVGPVELRRLAASFNTMIDTIERLLERRRAFVSYASHQLRNPLAALRLRAENLTLHLDRAGEEDHAMTLDEVDRLARVCDGLLALAHAESGKPPARTVVDAATIADARVAAWRPVAGRAGVRLVRSGAGSARASAMDGMLDQVLDALLDNAIKFVGPGATVTVTVTDADRDRDAVVVDVVDDGPGLPAEALAAAIEPYWRSPEDGRKAGSGLGLAIVAMLLAVGEGELTLESATPHGLCARVRLPKAAAVATASPGGSSAPPPDAAGAEASPRPPADSDAAPPDAPRPASTWR
jgi:signal transduction histidine kinase